MPSVLFLIFKKKNQELGICIWLADQDRPNKKNLSLSDVIGCVLFTYISNLLDNYIG